MRHFAVSAIGRDRPGIVAAVSGVLLEHKVNIEDSQMTILRGHFTMMLVVSAPDDTDPDSLHADLDRAREQLDLEAVSLSEVTGLEAAAEPVASHIVTVYGADHPGIVHAISSALADRGVNITDLTTRLVGEQEPEPLYAMMMEVALPQDMRVEELEERLETVRQEQSVEVTIRLLEQETL